MLDVRLAGPLVMREANPANFTPALQPGVRAPLVRETRYLSPELLPGEKINVSAKRAVLHVALRAPKDEKIVVDGRT